MPVINRLPVGLLGFLGIKNGGEYPHEMPSTLQPVWDLQGLYSSAASEVRVDQVAIAAIGSQAFTTVPNGETWLILLQSAACATLGAGQTIELQPNWTDPAALVNIETGPMSGARTVGQRASSCILDPYWAPPGSIMGINVTQLVAGPVTCALKTRFVRFVQ